MAKQGYGSDEQHFPSRVSLQLTPMSQPDILSQSVSPVHEASSVKHSASKVDGAKLSNAAEGGDGVIPLSSNG
jgi:hypothetical protein